MDQPVSDKSVLDGPATLSDCMSVMSKVEHAVLLRKLERDALELVKEIRIREQKELARAKYLAVLAEVDERLSRLEAGRAQEQQQIEALRALVDQIQESIRTIRAHMDSSPICSCGVLACLGALASLISLPMRYLLRAVRRQQTVVPDDAVHGSVELAH